MAVGLALLFNFRLPINFAAPLRSCSLFDLWRRWHITLSRFLVDFVYIPLEFGNPGPWRRAANLLITMVLAGLWHGANWTFLAWGAFHGVALLINFIWRHLRGAVTPSPVGRFFGWAATLTTLSIGSIFFRSSDIESCWRLLKAMVGFGDAKPQDQVLLPWDEWGIRAGYISEDFVRAWFGSTWSVVGTLWVVGALAVALFVPDTMEIADYREGEAHSDWRREFGSRIWTWRPTPVWLALQLALVVMVFNAMGRVSEFLYYQF
jgi:alginate O-acetyltransferase complex protein AlgI